MKRACVHKGCSLLLPSLPLGYESVPCIHKGCSSLLPFPTNQLPVQDRRSVLPLPPSLPSTPPPHATCKPGPARTSCPRRRPPQRSPRPPTPRDRAHRGSS